MAKRVKVKAKIRVYEFDGHETVGVEQPELFMWSHWNDGDRVVLQMADGAKITMVARDLEEAIRACTG